jgi:hypothetical protein
MNCKQFKFGESLLPFRTVSSAVCMLYKYICYHLFSLALQPSAGYGLLVTRSFLITQNDAPQSVGLPLGE